MDKYELRRLNLAMLVKERCGGIDAEMARRIERAPSYLARMLYEEGKKGKKRIGDDMTDVIEDAFNLPRGWLSTEQTSATLTTHPAVDTRALSQDASNEVLLAEQLCELVRIFCHSGPVGRERILKAARVAADPDHADRIQPPTDNQRKRSNLA